MTPPGERVIDEHGALVTVTVRPPRPVAALELCGELPCWPQAIAMTPVGASGAWEARLRVAPGVYEVKARAPGGAWWIDPAWRTITEAGAAIGAAVEDHGAGAPAAGVGAAGAGAAGVGAAGVGAAGAGAASAGAASARDDGGANGLLVVGGADEPVLHAPAAPWLVADDDGRVIVRAGLRRRAAPAARGGGAALSLRVDDGGGAVVRPMRRIDAVLDPSSAAAGGEPAGSHVWFEVELAGAGRALEYAFVLGDGRTIGTGGAAFRVPARALAPELPAWWRDAVVYTIFVDRFRRGGAGGAWRDPAAWGREHRAGGDLDGVVEALPYLADLGVTALHLTPVCPSPSAHRYDAIDPRAVDPALGGDAAYARLVDAAHARGLRVLADVAATHVHRDLAEFRDVRARGPASPYWRWFRATRWPFADGQDPGYAHYQKGQWQEPLLATDEPEVQAWIAETFASWVRRGADGVRVDAAADLPRPLIAQIRAAVRAARADAIVVGEVVPACVDRFAPAALDAATDFAAREALIAWLGGAAPAAHVARTGVERRRRGVAGPRGLGFVGTHDQPRVRTAVGEAARLGLVATALGARVPLLYYGDEVGLAAAEARARDFEDSWPDRQPMPWDEAAWDGETRALVRAALALRAREPLLRRGDETVLAAGDDVVIVRRARLGDAIDVVLHRGDAPRELALPPGAGAAILLTAGDAALIEPDEAPRARGGGPRLRLGPRAVAVVDRRAAADPDEPLLRAGNAALAARAFVDGHVATPAYPSRLYLTVTEACNLRCAHCITDAPARTQSGRARTLAPWLLDALGDAFAHADYVAFTHGGESITAPIFPEVLRRLARARAGRPGRADVHLASNGTLLDEARVAALADGGVTSIMVSLDGATAATNDRIRVLGRFDHVVANLAAAVRLRARRGLDLRLGVSMVVTASNVGEVGALARRCVDLGLDWLKLEETYPASPFARRELLAPDAPAVVDAMHAARAALAGSPVVLVDHLAPPAGCACSDDPRARAFRAADDFANRAAFRPCRAAWEQAAVDPDGVVHVVDYAGARLGSLLDAPLLALWNAAPALDARTAALAAAEPARRRRCVDAAIA